MPGQRIFIVPLIGWFAVVGGTVAAFVFLTPGGDGWSRGFTFIWIGLTGFILALVLALIAARTAKTATGSAARLARILPRVMLIAVLAFIALRVVLTLLLSY